MNPLSDLHPKDLICEYIANKLPDRVILWVITRVFAHALTNECKGKSQDEIRYEDVWHSWNNKILGKTIK